jgi:2-haloacid dehalogenase
MIHVVLWDVGNVLLRWDVRELYRRVFDDPEEMERFLAEVWTSAHNLRCDGGEPFEAVVAEVVAEHPHYEQQVRAAHERWIETIPGPVPGMAELLADLRAAGCTQIGLTNFSAQTFPLIADRPEVALLDDVVVSGRLGVLKPEPAIYLHALELAGARPAQAVFVDDSLPNVEGARAVGIEALHFVDAAQVRADLARLGVPPHVTGAVAVSGPAL